MKKLTILVLCVTMVFTIASPISASETLYRDGELLVDGNLTAREFRESQSIVAYQHMYESLDDELYGGIYVDEDGNLNIWYLPSSIGQLKADTDGAKAEAKKQFNNESIPFSVTYRYTLLSMETMHEVSDKLLSEAAALGIFGTSIDERQNLLQIKVDLDTYNLHEIELICEPLNGGFILEQGSEMEDWTAVPNGAGVAPFANAPYDNQFTIGVGIQYRNPFESNIRYGFLTAGHCGSVGDNVFLGGTQIGRFVYSRENNTEGVDLAIIERWTANISASQYFSDGARYDNILTATPAPVGSTIKVYSKGNRVHTGVIWSNNSNFTFNGVLWYNLIETRLSKANSPGPGDSGSPLVYSAGANHVVGILRGGNNSNALAEICFSKTEGLPGTILPRVYVGTWAS